MGLSIRFTFDPPTPYHTLSFHQNRGIRQKFMDMDNAGKIMPALGADLYDSLKMLTEFPDGFSMIVLPSRIFAHSLLQRFFHSGISVIPAPPGYGISLQQDMNESAFSVSTIPPRGLPERIPQLDTDFLICVDSDPSSGSIFHTMDIRSVKSYKPELTVCLDNSLSYMNATLNFPGIDAYLFDTAYVTGMQPSITMLLVPGQLGSTIMLELKDILMFPESGNEYPQFLIHREVDLLRLYVFKEICYDMIRRDPKIIRNEIIYKSYLLYTALTESSHFDPVVRDPDERSPNILSARILSSPEIITGNFRSKGILFDMLTINGIGYHARFSNFPVHSREQVEFLADAITGLN